MTSRSAMASTSQAPILRLGTRGSLLALAQSGSIAALLEARHPGLRVEKTIFKTTGDQITGRPLHEFGGKGLFTKELEQALLDGSIDLAVHSFKDMPVTMPLVDQSMLMVAAVPPREDPLDALVSHTVRTIQDLPAGARVGTGSLRRRCQVLALRSDLRVEQVRGNIDTRLRKLREGQFDAILLAMAGLKRAGLFEPGIMHPLNADVMLPAPGQGALALQCRRDDADTRALLAALHDADTADCVTAERALVADLEGDCLSPIGSLAMIDADKIVLRAAIGGRGGNPPILRAKSLASRRDPAAAASAAFADLAVRGAKMLLHGAG